MQNYIPHRAIDPKANRLSVDPAQRRTTHMEKFSQEELKAYLINSNEEYRSLAEKHAEYARLIDEIETKPHVTPEDEVEEHRLKKLKLACKDQMQAIVNRHLSAQVA